MKVLLIIFALFSLCFSANDLEIKGLKIGMTVDEVNNNIPIKYYIMDKVISEDSMSDMNGFKFSQIISLAGRKPVTGDVVFFKNISDQINFYFASSDFDFILSAVSEKYKNIKCSESTISNIHGALFTQKDCFISDSKSVLSFKKYYPNIDVSRISIKSHRRISEEQKVIESGKKDI